MMEETEKATPEAVAMAEINKERALTTFGDAFGSVAAFGHAERVAKVFAASTLVPDHFRGQTANCLIALEMAKQLDLHPLLLMQGIYTVKNRIGWGSSFLINLVNSRGPFQSGIRWYVRRLEPGTLPAFYMSGARGSNKKAKIEYDMLNLGVTAYAASAGTEDGLAEKLAGLGTMGPAEAVAMLQSLSNSGQLVASPEVTSAMAIADGWASGNSANAKYESLPELMLRYRSAGFLVRLYCPEVLMGFRTLEEIEPLPPAKEVAPISLALAEGKPLERRSEALDTSALLALSQEIEDSAWSVRQVEEAMGVALTGPAAITPTADQARQIRGLLACDPPAAQQAEAAGPPGGQVAAAEVVDTAQLADLEGLVTEIRAACKGAGVDFEALIGKPGNMGRPETWADNGIDRSKLLRRVGQLQPAPGGKLEALRDQVQALAAEVELQPETVLMDLKGTDDPVMLAEMTEEELRDVLAELESEKARQS